MDFNLSENENYLNFLYKNCQDIVDSHDSFKEKEKEKENLINSTILAINNGSLEEVKQNLKKLDSIEINEKTKKLIHKLIKKKTNSINPFKVLIPKLKDEKKVKTEDISEEVLNKACLSLGIRLKLEEFIINNSDENLRLSEINRDQTSYLLSKDKKLTKKYNLRKYEIATSNIIHLNSLNYEPLFYYDYEELKKIYKEISDL